MIRIKRIALLTAASLVLSTPATIALADNGGFSNSVQVLGYGHNGTQHYTNYSERYRGAYTATYASGYGKNFAFSYNAGQTAASKVTAPESVYHTHEYSGFDL